MRPSPQILLLALLGCGSESSDTTRLQPIVADDVMGIALHDAVGEGTVALPIRQVNTYGAAIPGGKVSIAEAKFDFEEHLRHMCPLPESNAAAHTPWPLRWCRWAERARCRC